MKVQVRYTEDVSDDFRRAINARHGEPGLATRQQVKNWFHLYGQSMNDELMFDLGLDDAKRSRCDD